MPNFLGLMTKIFIIVCLAVGLILLSISAWILAYSSLFQTASAVSFMWWGIFFALPAVVAGTYLIWRK